MQMTTPQQYAYNGSINTVWFTVGQTYQLVKHSRLQRVIMTTNDRKNQSIPIERLERDFTPLN